MTYATGPGVAAGQAIDPRRYHEAADPEPLADRARAAGLPLSRGDQPLQPPVHDLPAHLRRPRAARGHGLGSVSFDRRPASEPQARRAAWGRRADAGEASAEDGALSGGAERLRALQHQRHRHDRAQRAGPDRGRARRAARFARRGDAGNLQGRPRQGLFRPHSRQRAPVPDDAGPRRRSEAARLPVADGPQGDGRRTPGFRAHRGGDRASGRSICSGSSSSTRTRSGSRGPTRPYSSG